VRQMRTKGVRKAIVGLAVIVMTMAGAGVAVAATSRTTATTAAGSRGVNEYGKTDAFYDGHAVDFKYTKGYYCDTSVTSSASTKCEAGAKYTTPPSPSFDPLYITVPLGFTVPMNMQDCPSMLQCVDHPGTIDLTRLESALKPLYPKLTDAQLTAALGDFMVPGHDHFITTTAGGKAEWWDVQIVGVTSPKTLASIRSHKSNAYLQKLIKAKNKNVVGPIPTNLFLYFSAK
jgi:hypothetical protein